MDVYTLSGKMIALQEPAIKSGGEGAVYNIIGHNDVVAKIYLSKTDAGENESKIREMSGLSQTEAFRNSGILDDIAWPLAPLFNKAKEFIGFGMRRIMAKYELDDIYALGRKNNAGMSTYEKVTTLISLCEGVEKLHRYKQVLGDFNPNNMKIDERGNVQFVDADSYHFNSGKQIYPCKVCAPGYVAPELIKKCKGTTYAAYQGTTFTKETDNFSLAIHCFRMLMNGCHPFTCKKHVRNTGSTPAPSIDKRVENGETPFFRKVENFTTPDWAPDITCLPPYLRTLFERAFVEGHGNPSARPEASEWKTALERYRKEIKPCSDPMHWYWKQLRSCPYCEAGERGKKNLISTMTAGKKRYGSGGGGYPQSGNAGARNTNRLNAGKTAPAVTFGTVPGAVPHHSCNTAGTSAAAVQKKKLGFGKISKPAINSVLYWVITILLALGTHVLLGIYAYAPIYRMAGGTEWIEWVGTAGSVISGVAGTILYGRKWSSAQWLYPSVFQWYDYLLSWLTGLGFAIGFGVAFFVVTFAFVVFLYILVAIIIVSMIMAVVSDLFF